MIGEVNKIPKLKTINGNSIYGSGDIEVGTSSVHTLCALEAFSAKGEKTVDVEGVTENSNVILDLVVSNESEVTAAYTAWSHIYRAVAGNGTITFYSNAATSTAVLVQVIII